MIINNGVYLHSETSKLLLSNGNMIIVTKPQNTHENEFTYVASIPF